MRKIPSVEKLCPMSVTEKMEQDIVHYTSTARGRLLRVDLYMSSYVVFTIRYVTDVKVEF